ncbi:MAG: MTH1187 family thiamine-binding protein [Deltaproteobacteria bacterium]|nr:MTH1187 family thiamine-binding protein [Deltaproteobacteria bacterium]
MRALAEIQVIPLGAGPSVREEVTRAHRLIEASGLTVQLHAYGTNVEGELSEILKVIETIHETLHAEGVVRLSTAIKLGTRTDKVPTLAAKKL